MSRVCCNRIVDRRTWNVDKVSSTIHDPRSTILLCLCLLLAGCRGSEVRFQRIAILPFENLTGDASLDWMGRGFSELAGLHITGSPTAQPVQAAALRETAGLGATQILHGYFSKIGESWRVEAVLEDAGSRRMVRWAAAAGPASGGIAPLASAVTLQVAGSARPLGALDEAGLKAWVEGLSSADPAAAREALQRAAASAPDFGAAYVTWAQWLMAHGQRAGAQQVIRAAGQRQIPEVERARLRYLESVLEKGRAEQYQALITLSRVTPADPEVFRNLAQMDLAVHRYPAAVDSYQKAVARTPESVQLWNELGYARSYTRDLPGALEALRRYQQLRPLEANPLDSQGDVHFYMGRFLEAGKFYLEGYGKQPGFLGGGELFKAAWARLMSGDRPAADSSFQKYLAFRRSAGDPLIEYRQAEWEFLTGRRPAALARLERFAKGPAASLAFSQLSIWSLVSGDPERARQYAAQALTAARQPASRLLPALCSFLSQPPASAGEWQARAERDFPDPAQLPAKQYVLACALLLGKHSAAALPLARQLYGQTPPSSPDPVNVLLAWALIDSQRFAELGELLNTYPVPRPDSEQPFLALSFPRVFFLRGVYLEKQGRKQEAQASYKLYTELSH